MNKEIYPQPEETQAQPLPQEAGTTTETGEAATDAPADPPAGKPDPKPTPPAEEEN